VRIARGRRETGQRFSEIESAISGIEKYIQPTIDDSVISTNQISTEIVSDLVSEICFDTTQENTA
jgi:hypothetical protein